jgi:carboxymethylenebutenolidase
MSTVTLQAADGATFRGSLAIADGARGAGVVVLPDRDGLRGFHIELAGRFAAAGHHAIAIELHRRASFQVDLDIRAATELIGLRTGARSYVSVGFGLGGAHALRAAGDPGLAGAVAVSPALRAGDAEHARAAVIPVLALFGGEDDPRAVAALGAALAEAGVERELVTYHGAPPGFLEAGGHPGADAWDRILGFLEPAALERVA